MTNIPFSTDLLNKPSSSKGAARLVDQYGLIDKYKNYKNENSADSEALKKDWNFVGKDIAGAINQYESRNRRGKK